MDIPIFLKNVMNVLGNTKIPHNKTIVQDMITKTVPT